MYNMDPYDDHSKPTKAQVDEIAAQTIKHFGKKLEEPRQEEQSMNHTVATIQGQTFHYEGPLTIEEIEEHRDTIIMMYIGRPTYLFLTEQGHRELAAAATQFYNSLCEPGEQKELSTLSMLCGLHVVVLPTLPENTLIIGRLEGLD